MVKRGVTAKEQKEEERGLGGSGGKGNGMKGRSKFSLLPPSTGA